MQEHEALPADSLGVVSAYNEGACRRYRATLFGIFAYSCTCSKRPAQQWNEIPAARRDVVCEKVK